MGIEKDPSMGVVWAGEQLAKMSVEAPGVSCVWGESPVLGSLSCTGTSITGCLELGVCATICESTWEATNDGTLVFVPGLMFFEGAYGSRLFSEDGKQQG